MWYSVDWAIFSWVATEPKPKLFLANHKRYRQCSEAIKTWTTGTCKCMYLKWSIAIGNGFLSRSKVNFAHTISVHWIMMHTMSNHICLLQEATVHMYIWMFSFGMIWVRINDARSHQWYMYSVHQLINPNVDSLNPLMHCELSDLGSLILCKITPKKCMLCWTVSLALFDSPHSI